MMLRRWLIGASVVGLFAYVFLFESSMPTRANSKTINITTEGVFASATPWVVNPNQYLNIENEDDVDHQVNVYHEADPSPFKSTTLPARMPSATPAALKYTFKSSDPVGQYSYVLDNNVSTGTFSFAIATPSPSESASASPTATATSTPTIAPTPTATPTETPTMTPTATPTVVPTESPSPTATPTSTPVVTATPTAVPTVTPSPTPTLTPTASPSPTPTVVPTVAPTATPTVTPTATPSLTPSPTVVPTVVPTSTPVPTVVPTPTPQGLVLPAFSIFRPTTCSANVLQNGKVLTEKLSSSYLKQGTWTLESSSNVNNKLVVNARLNSVRTVNLFFRGNSFFGGDKTTSSNELKVFSGVTLNDVLKNASDSWCARF